MHSNELLMIVVWSFRIAVMRVLDSFKLPGWNPWKKHWTHTLSFMVMYEDMKVIHCTIKTNGCHVSHKVHKVVLFMSCMFMILYDSMTVINWTIIWPLYALVEKQECFVGFNMLLNTFWKILADSFKNFHA